MTKPSPTVKGKAASEPDRRQYPTESAPLPVRVIESPSDAAHTKEREAQSTKHDAADLKAQERTADATEEQVLASKAAVVLSLFGLVGLGLTFCETRRTAIAAVKSASIAQSMAWPIVVPRIANATFLYPPKGHQGPFAKPQLTLSLENYGQSPAFMVAADCELRISWDTPPQSELVRPLKKEDRTVIPVRPEPSTYQFLLWHDPVTPEQVTELNGKLDAGGKRFFLIGRVIYDDVFGERHTSGFCLKIFRNGTSVARGGEQFNYFRRGKRDSGREPGSEQDDDGGT